MGGKGGRKQSVPRGSKGARKRLAEVTAELDKARAKRAKAQARVEALEALAEELAERVAAEATAASEEKGRGAVDAQLTAEPATIDGADDATATAPAVRADVKTRPSPKAPRPAKPAAPTTRTPRPTVEPA